jgi:hypothetical protein
MSPVRSQPPRVLFAEASGLPKYSMRGGAVRLRPISSPGVPGHVVVRLVDDAELEAGRRAPEAAHRPVAPRRAVRWRAARSRSAR